MVALNVLPHVWEATHATTGSKKTLLRESSAVKLLRQTRSVVIAVAALAVLHHHRVPPNADQTLWSSLAFPPLLMSKVSTHATTGDHSSQTTRSPVLTLRRLGSATARDAHATTTQFAKLTLNARSATMVSATVIKSMKRVDTLSRVKFQRRHSDATAMDANARPLMQVMLAPQVAWDTHATKLFRSLAAILTVIPWKVSALTAGAAPNAITTTFVTRTDTASQMVLLTTSRRNKERSVMVHPSEQ